MLGLVQQVGGEQAHVRATVGDHEALGRPEDHECDRAVALHLDLRRLHRRAARPEHLEHLRDRLRAERERGDAGRAVRAEDVAQAELVRDDEHGRVDLAAGPGTGGTTTAISGTPATIAGVPICTSTDGNEPLPLGMYSPALAIGVVFSPSIRPGSSSMRQSAPSSTRSL